MLNHQIGAQLYTVRHYMQNETDMKASLARIAEIGYRAVQVSAIGAIASERFKELADQNDLTICAAHYSYDQFTQDLDAIIKEQHTWGCQYAGLSTLPRELRADRAGYETFVKTFNPIAHELEQAGIKFCYHNHYSEFERFDGRRGIDILFEDTDPTAFHFILDTYWIQYAGANPARWIERAKERNGVLHLKDMAIINHEQTYAPVGQGNLDWDGILQSAESHGVEWYVVEQDETAGDPFEALRQSYDYLMKQ